MDDEPRTPITLIVSGVIVVLAVGLAAYYMGRFGRSPGQPPRPSVELPEPGAPAPAVARDVATPADVPPTVTAALPVVVERGRGSSGVMIEKSSQIVVPVGTPVPVAPAPSLAPAAIAPPPTPRRRIVVEVQPSPTPTPISPEALAPPPPPFETPTAIPTPPPEPSPLEEPPEPEPEPTSPPAV